MHKRGNAVAQLRLIHPEDDVDQDEVNRQRRSDGMHLVIIPNRTEDLDDDERRRHELQV